ncbi:divalent-cation tolerance protein CutA [Streptomyces sp. NPDC046939]|uniref:divalent-cation tolerance protein CutA n=1 Tax=Streptomyces sp. NPDC046939 TaxID=3155376 RepID=UPI0033E5780C
MTETEIRTVTVTAPDPEWLAAFVRELVADRLCACGHITESIRSVYRWEGEVQDDREAHVSLHTSAERVPELLRRIEERHPYDVPCAIVSTMHAAPSYAAWVHEETRPGRG